MKIVKALIEFGGGFRASFLSRNAFVTIVTIVTIVAVELLSASLALAQEIQPERQVCEAATWANPMPNVPANVPSGPLPPVLAQARRQQFFTNTVLSVAHCKPGQMLVFVVSPHVHSLYTATAILCAFDRAIIIVEANRQIDPNNYFARFSCVLVEPRVGLIEAPSR